MFRLLLHCRMVCLTAPDHTCYFLTCAGCALADIRLAPCSAGTCCS